MTTITAFPITPASVAAGRAMLRTLDHEIESIQAQVEAGHLPRADGSLATPVEFRAWRLRAKLALAHKRFEAAEVRAWLADHDIGPQHLLHLCRERMLDRREDADLVVLITDYLVEHGHEEEGVS